MTSEWRGTARRSNGSIVTRSDANSWRLAAELHARCGPGQERLERPGPVLLRAEQQADQVRTRHVPPLPPGPREQIGKVRIEGVAPGDEVVRVAVDRERHVVALAAQRAAIARLLARFSSGAPQVMAIGIGVVAGAPSSIRPTKRAIRLKRAKPASWPSQRCRK